MWMRFGTLATTISVFLISRSKNLILAGLYPVLLNGVIVGLELHYILEFPLLISAMGFVALGEFVVVTTVGVILHDPYQERWLSRFDRGQSEPSSALR